MKKPHPCPWGSTRTKVSREGLGRFWELRRALGPAPPRGGCQGGTTLQAAWASQVPTRSSGCPRDPPALSPPVQMRILHVATTATACACRGAARL